MIYIDYLNISEYWFVYKRLLELLRLIKQITDVNYENVYSR